MNEEKPSEELVEALAADELPPEGVEEVMSQATIKRAAALGAAGATRYAIAKQLKISNYYAAKIMRDEEYKRLVEDIGNDAVANIKSVIKTDLARLHKKAITAIEKNLDKHNLQAAVTVLRALGVETAPKDDNADKGGLTLVLAGQPTPQPATIVVKQKDEK